MGKWRYISTVSVGTPAMIEIEYLRNTRLEFYRYTSLFGEITVEQSKTDYIEFRIVNDENFCGKMLSKSSPPPRKKVTNCHKA
jgi:hypothetical protein